MLFEFQLLPLEEIQPWGGDKPSLSWFGLTDGLYWWNVGSQELFRYSQAINDHWRKEDPNYPLVSPYEDYQISRPWEDLLHSLPTFLDPVPNDLVQRTQQETWPTLREKTWDWASDRNEDGAWDLWYTAFSWWSERNWDAGYLRCPPKIWLWTQEDTFHLRWDNREVLYDDIPVWESTFGEITMPRTAFIEEVRSFDKRLIEAMAERVSAVCSGALRSEIDINLEWLAHEQQDRSTWLENALARAEEKSDWEKVRKALDDLEQICYNNGVEGP